jgi:recombination protein RecA
MSKRVATQSKAPVAADTRDRLTRMQSVSKRFEQWRPAAQVLTRVRAVPTRFVQVDHATKVAGWPIERFATVHGPSNHGKTAFCHGLGLSFLERGHFYAFVDAEYTTPEDWLAKLMGEHSTHPGFVALRPHSFEETVDAVRGFCEQVAEARAKGEIDADTSAIVVVDSMKKLVPKRLLERIAKDGADNKKGSVDGYGGRAAQYKAALISQWLDEMVPLLYHTGTSMVAITREADDPDADQRDKQFDAAWKVQGGKSLVYEASLVVRITRESWTHETSDKASPIVGERHLARIWKTKVGGKEDKHADAYFHTSNGVQVPEGFDRARDVLELGVALGIVEQAGAWFRWGGHKWNGEAKALHALCDVGVLAELEAEVRAQDAPKETP